MFDWKKPTSQMLGRWQPWHKGHTELFKKALNLSGQVCIMFRDVSGVDAGVDGQSDNPFEFEEVRQRIIKALQQEGFEYEREYIVIKVPNITDISFGRGVGYTIEEVVLPEKIQKISATKIRDKMRKEGKLK